MIRRQSDAPQLKSSACCLGLAVDGIQSNKGGQLHCLRLHGSAWPYFSNFAEQQRCERSDPCALSSGRMESMDTTPPSAGRRSLKKTGSPGSITAGRSSMKTIVCFQERGTSLTYVAI